MSETNAMWREVHKPYASVRVMARPRMVNVAWAKVIQRREAESSV